MVRQEDNSYIGEKEMDGHSVEVRMSGKVYSPEENNASFKKLVNSSVIIVLVILVFIAIFSFFFNMQEAIVALINPKYQALIQALFSLLVLIIGIYLIKLFLSNKN